MATADPLALRGFAGRRRRMGAVFLLLAVGLWQPAGADDAVVAIDLVGDLFPAGAPSSQGWLRIAPRVTRRLSPRVAVLVAPVLEADTHSDVDRSTFYDDDDRGRQRALLRFDRLSVRFELGSVRLEVGKQPLTWGRTDAINPTDNLTPRDWTDPLREVRLSPWAVRLNVEKRRWEAELALVPRYAPSRLPRLDGRWALLEPGPLADPAFPAAGPPELELELAAARFPATDLNNLQAGLRLGRRGTRTEWALSYYRGFDDAPHFDVDVGRPAPGAATLPVTLRPRYPRLEVAGADGVLLAGAWALRGEAGYFRFPEGRDDDFLLWELDAELTRGSWQFVAGYADVAGADHTVALDPPSGGAAGAAALDLGALPAVFLHLGRSLPTEWAASLEVVLGTRELDSLVQLSGSWPVGGGTRLGAEIDLIGGDRGSFFGAWRDNDRLRVFARMAF